MHLNVGQKLYVSVLSVFVLFALCFLVFQQIRERHYKVEMLDLRLQNYNKQLKDHIDQKGFNNNEIKNYVANQSPQDLRVTLIDKNGNVFFDNLRSDYAAFNNHANRPEIKQARAKGHGSTVERTSITMEKDYFYSATWYADKKIYIRSALPYNNDLAASLHADQHFIWFALIAIVILTAVLYRFINRLGNNITKLNLFASNAAQNKSLEIDDLRAFPNDELGEIAERIIKIYKQLESTRNEQDRLKRELTQNIAHELKTPVASIQGYLEILLNNPRVNDENRQKFLQNSYAQCQRLASLITDISTLNRISDAPDIKEFKPVDIAHIIEKVEIDTKMQLEAQGMDIKKNIPARINVMGNESLLYSVFRNLTDNAIAYAGKNTRITITAELKDNYWFFTYADNGVGVSEKHLSRLCERFYRVDKGRSRMLGGTGLGLAIVKNAVLLHNGTIQVKKRPGGGLLFEFSICALMKS